MIITYKSVDGKDVCIVRWKEGNKTIGHIYKEIDGYYVFVFISSLAGFFTADLLRCIGDIAPILDSMNKEWDKEVAKECKGV